MVTRVKSTISLFGSQTELVDYAFMQSEIIRGDGSVTGRMERILGHYTVLATCFAIPALSAVNLIYGSSNKSVFFLFLSGIYIFILSYSIFKSVKSDNNSEISLSLLYIFMTCLTIVLNFANIFKITGLNMGDVTIHSASSSIFYSASVWTTLGFGQYTATKEAELYTIILAVLGYIYMAIIVSVIFALVNKIPKNK